MVWNIWKRWRRSRLTKQTIDSNYWIWAERHLARWPLWRDDIRQRLVNKAWILWNERHFETSKGLDLSDEMKWAIATNAAMMLMGVEDYFFDGVKTILLHPETFLLPQQNAWVVSHVPAAGAAWQYGPVVLSWADCLPDSPLKRQGRNVIVHEFAHHLDGIDGEMGGSITMPTVALAEQWIATAARERQTLEQATRLGHRTLLDSYAATNSAEFFAVTSEYFFERPDDLANQHAEIFSLLQKYYQTDPREWTR